MGSFAMKLIVIAGVITFVSCNVCDEPKKIGPCKALKPRYFFNRETNTCEHFGWGGCQANGNNFRSAEECRTVCKTGETQTACDQPMKIGPCEANIKRFYFDSSKGKCRKFYWGGCEENENNFEKRKDCHRECM